MKRKLIKLALCCVFAGLVLAISSISVAASDGQSTTFITGYSLRLRSGPSTQADVIQTVPRGSTVQVTNFRDGEWFAVNIGGTRGYMYAEHLFAPFETTDNLRLRTGPSLQSSVVQTVPRGTAVQVIDFRDGEWFAVDVDGARGYMYAEHLAAPFTTTDNLRLRAGPSTQAEIVQTVSRGSTVRVTNFRDGEWFAVEVDGVRGYMFAEHLTETEGSVVAPSGPVIGSNSVELLHWSEARNLLRTGVSVQITDVRTGITYQIRSFSHGNHADVEPVTAEDTAAMLRTYNGRWSWTPRPVWVHIGDRTIAASINGMPHAGSTISGNNMNGHVCLHFYGSRTHNGNTGHERNHQNAVQEAFRAAR